MVLPILTYPNPILRQRTKDVDWVAHSEIVDMKDTLEKFDKGAALAANQVGIERRIFVIDRKLARLNSVPDVIINPTVIRHGKILETMDEGCLSFPGKRYPITRPKKVEVKFNDLSGWPIKVNLSGFIARVFQHEIDHLDGVLFIDHLENKNA